MSKSFEIYVPLLNPNEPEVQVAVHVTEGQPVKPGDLLFTFETTKSTSELHAEQEGFISGLLIPDTGTARAAERLCWIAPDPSWEPPQAEVVTESSGEGIPEGLRITAPALSRARELNVDLSSLPIGPLVTERMISGGEAPLDLVGELTPKGKFRKKEIIVYGGGGHGRSVIDLIRAMDEYEIVGVVDDGISSGQEIVGVPVIGGADQLAKLVEDGVKLAANAVGGVGDIRSRVSVFHRMIQAGFGFPILIHPTAFVEPNASLSAGVQVFPHAYIGSEAEVGFGGIVNTSASVSHNCVIGSYSNIAPGALIAGGVKIGRAALVGMGVTINLEVEIGEYARLGNSAVVKSDVPAGGIVGAGKIWPAD